MFCETHTILYFLNFSVVGWHGIFGELFPCTRPPELNRILCEPLEYGLLLPVGREPNARACACVCVYVEIAFHVSANELRVRIA